MSTRVPGAWRRFYGHHPLHLVLVVGTVVLTGYVVSLLGTDPTAPWILAWFVAALLGHDLVLFPLYALVDRVLSLAHRWRRHRRRRVPLINYVRVPALGSALLGLMFLPTITRHGEPAFLGTSGRTMEGYLQTWVVVSAVLFACSAVVYLTVLAARARRDGNLVP